MKSTDAGEVAIKARRIMAHSMCPCATPVLAFPLPIRPDAGTLSAYAGPVSVTPVTTPI
jgi:hypothetical protein